ncbi:hypothetical protein NCC78_19940 [Micromonospora phytophila]|uniref:hypothetical protein n=1 Tax=Micromonospora phytophila TaxID=709888 RepID=UPI00202E5A65|nr:hypothetical protein [Micromonospora phytophila]MCM0676942.1 hypothetical protein [Micromonospora phytophila]
MWEIRRTWDYVGAALVTSTPGSIEIVACDADSKSKGNWTCHAPFTSDDGTVRIDSISLRVPVEEGPGSTGPAVVSGMGAERAWAPHWGTTVGRLGVHAIAGFAGWLAWAFFQAALVSGQRWGPRVPTPRTLRLARNQHRTRRRKPARLRRR